MKEVTVTEEMMFLDGGTTVIQTSAGRLTFPSDFDEFLTNPVLFPIDAGLEDELVNMVELNINDKKLINSLGVNRKTADHNKVKFTCD